jgi:CheY-like chemotaxis protein
MTILFVEEDLFFAEAVKRAFAARGIEMLHTTKADSVVDVAMERQLDVVLFDLRLSKLNGFELLQALKEDPRTSELPLMVWSHIASQEDIQRCFSLGACEYFLKGQHAPHEVAHHIARRFNRENGFTLPEWLAVGLALLLAASFTFLQVHRVLDMRRDDGQLIAVRSAVSAIVAAGQARDILAHCKEEDGRPTPLHACKLCKEESCQNELPVPWTYTPTYERAVLDPEHTCTPISTHPCHVSIERDGTQPISTNTFKIRFFLARDRDGLKGGQTHTINKQGVLE